MSTDTEQAVSTPSPQPNPNGRPLGRKVYIPNRKQHPKKYLGLRHDVRLPNGKRATHIQVIRHADGFDLPRSHSAAVRRAWRSKYAPGLIGPRHAARLAKRAALKTQPTN